MLEPWTGAKLQRGLTLDKMFAWIILLQLKRGAAKAASLQLYVKLYQLKIIMISHIPYIFLTCLSIQFIFFAFYEVMLKECDR